MVHENTKMIKELIQLKADNVLHSILRGFKRAEARTSLHPCDLLQKKLIEDYFNGN